MGLLYFHPEYYYHSSLSLSYDLRIFLFNSNGCSFFFIFLGDFDFELLGYNNVLKIGPDRPVRPSTSHKTGMIQ